MAKVRVRWILLLLGIGLVVAVALAPPPAPPERVSGDAPWKRGATVTLEEPPEEDVHRFDAIAAEARPLCDKAFAPVFPPTASPDDPKDLRLAAGSTLMLSRTREDPAWKPDFMWPEFAPASSGPVQVYACMDFEVLTEWQAGPMKHYSYPGQPFVTIRLIRRSDGQVLASRRFVTGRGGGAGDWLRSAFLEPAVLPHDTNVRSLAFTPDGRRLIVGTYDNYVTMWELETGTMLRRFAAGAGLDALWLLPDGNALVTHHRERIAVWEVETGTLTREIPTAPALAAALSPDGKTMATGGSGGVRLWSLADGRQTRTLDMQGVERVAFSLDGAFVAGGDGYATATMTLWAVATGQKRCSITLGRSHEHLAGFLDNETVASFTFDGVTFWNTDGRRLGRLKGEMPGTPVMFAPDRTRIAGGPTYGSVGVWELATGRLLLSAPAEYAEDAVPIPIAISPDGRRLATRGREANWVRLHALRAPGPEK